MNFLLWLVSIGILILIKNFATRVLLPAYGIRNIFYAQKSVAIKSSSLNAPDLEVKYRGMNVETLNSTEIQVWNHGEDEIFEEKLIKPLSISYPPDSAVVGTELVVVRGMQLENISIGDPVTFEDGGGRINVSFEKLGPYASFMLRIYHAGERSTSFEVVGKQDDNKLRIVPVDSSFLNASKFSKMARVIVLLFGLLIVSYSTVVSMLFLGDFLTTGGLHKLGGVLYTLVPLSLLALFLYTSSSYLRLNAPAYVWVMWPKAPLEFYN